MCQVHLTSNEIEAANRAEATAILIRSGFRVYRPEADTYGEDLVVRSPSDDLRVVQLKGRPAVDLARYGNRSIWMLFPDPAGQVPGRDWFLIPHDKLFDYVRRRHGQAPRWRDVWSYPLIPNHLGTFLEPFSHHHWCEH